MWYAQRLKALKSLYSKSLKTISVRDLQRLWGKLAKKRAME
jgi:hypothetical protein